MIYIPCDLTITHLGHLNFQIETVGDYKGSIKQFVDKSILYTVTFDVVGTAGSASMVVTPQAGESTGIPDTYYGCSKVKIVATFAPDYGYYTKLTTSSSLGSYFTNFKGYNLIEEEAMVSQNTAFTVDFLPLPTYTVDVAVIGGKGTYNITKSTNTHPEGSDVTVKFVPEKGYVIKNVLVCDNPPMKVNSYTIENISANCKIAVEFEEKPPNKIGRINIKQGKVEIRPRR